ncbi:helix-turn-helix domain-containing protein [Paraflavitalea pollutisoli]|uniref:helix-turn-helix domain-containing protein n=1 Tax=Paraflavitalea pollutisoli TaxID=3034143 RepID=UPI0023EB6D83|nr:helix-turn-helix domain-containing protein [Paraflavitalea sp. H1-2-19X]
MNTTALFQYFVVAGLINTSLFAFLLLTKKKHTIVSVLLIVLMLLLSFQALLNAFDTRSFFLRFPHLSKISWLLPTLFGPLIYLFTYHITSRSQHFHRRALLHFIPFVAYFVLLLPWYVQSADDKRATLNDFDAASVADFGWMNQFTIPWTLAYLLFSLRQLRLYRESLTDTHSEISLYQFQWLRQFIYIILAILGITIFGFYGRKWDIPFLTNFYHYNYAIIVLVLYWVAYKSITQPALFNLEGRGRAIGSNPVKQELVAERAAIAGAVDSGQHAVADRKGVTDAGSVQVTDLSMPLVQEVATRADDMAHTTTEVAPGMDEPVEGKKYAKSGLDAATTEQLLTRLLDYMERERPYLQPELTIYTLAEALNTNRHHLSQVINERLHVSFFDFINRYRVKAVQAKMADPGTRSMSILGIAYDCGFNSKATFNTSFKKYTGMTPSAYLQSLGQ